MSNDTPICSSCKQDMTEEPNRVIVTIHPEYGIQIERHGYDTNSTIEVLEVALAMCQESIQDSKKGIVNNGKQNSN